MLTRPQERKYNDIYNNNWVMVFFVAKKRLGDIHLSEDASIDTFKDAYIQFHKLEHSAPRQASSYLRKTSRSKSCDIYRKWKKIRDNTYDNNDDLKTMYDPEMMEDKLLREYAKSAVKEAVRALPPIYRDTIEFQLSNGLSPKQIAKIQRLKKPTVVKRLQRARVMIKKYLVEKYGDKK